MMLTNENNSDFYELEAIQKIIDFQFLRARSFFLKLFFLYTLGFILPIVVAYIID